MNLKAAVEILLGCVSEYEDMLDHTKHILLQADNAATKELINSYAELSLCFDRCIKMTAQIVTVTSESYIEMLRQPFEVSEKHDRV